jgi:hypothetical protein
MPPPTVKGISSSVAARSTRSSIGRRPSIDAVTSREDELVGAELRIARRQLDRVADVAEALEAGRP